MVVVNVRLLALGRSVETNWLSANAATELLLHEHRGYLAFCQTVFKFSLRALTRRLPTRGIVLFPRVGVGNRTGTTVILQSVRTMSASVFVKVRERFLLLAF